MGSIWSLVPNRLLDEEEFLELDEGGTCLLLQLYVLCDGYGLAPAGPNFLRSRTNCIDPEAGLKSLESRGFIVRYVSDRGRQYCSLSGYEDDIPATFATKRGKPQYPRPPWEGAWSASQGSPKGSPGADQGSPKGSPPAPKGVVKEKERGKNRKKRGKNESGAASSLMHEGLT